MDDFEIPGQLPVLQELESTDGLVLWIFVISLLPMSSRSRNLFLVVSQSYHACSGDLENPSQLPVSEVLQGTVDWVLWISVISSFLTISMSGNLFIVVSHGRYFRMTSKFQVNFRVLQELEGTDGLV